MSSVKTAPEHNVTPAQCAAIAAELFAGASPLMRAMQRYRPYICPFHLLLERVPADAAVLDVGCGAGLFLGLLAATRRIRAGHGFDSSSGAITVAQAMRRAGPPGLRFEHRAVEDAWPNETFDVVSLIDVMHHVPLPAREGLVAQMGEHVGLGGRLIYKDMVARPRWRATANRLHDLVLARQWVRYQPLDAVVRWCERQGLRLVERQSVDMLWYGHEWVVMERPRS